MIRYPNKESGNLLRLSCEPENWALIRPVSPERRGLIRVRGWTFGPGNALRNATSGIPSPEVGSRRAEPGRFKRKGHERPGTGHPPGRTGFVGGHGRASRLTFDDSDAGEIFRAATATVRGLAPCQVEASYRSVNGGFVRFPPSQPEHPDIERHRESGWDGQVDAGTAGGGGRSRCVTEASSTGVWWSVPPVHRRKMRSSC